MAKPSIFAFSDCSTPSNLAFVDCSTPSILAPNDCSTLSNLALIDRSKPSNLAFVDCSNAAIMRSIERLLNRCIPNVTVTNPAKSPIRLQIWGSSTTLTLS